MVLGGFTFTERANLVARHREGTEAILDGRPEDAAKPALDLTVTGVSVVTGPWGWVAGTGYFAIDQTIGWEPVIDSMDRAQMQAYKDGSIIMWGP